MEHPMTTQQIQTALKELLGSLSGEQLIDAINAFRQTLHAYSPFKEEPVDCVTWVKTKRLVANDYNPNNVAPGEKRLLTTSLMQDGFTQPIVVSPETASDRYAIVDGFHRFELGKKNPDLKKRLLGYVPVVMMPEAGNDKSRRIAATIRHNRARGRHQINAMAEIVRELSQLGWNDEKISRELGMDADEVLRLKQVCGLFELFSDRKFSQAWTVK